MTDLTPWGDPKTEWDGAPGGVRRSTIARERSTRLWVAVLSDLRAAGMHSPGVLYLDVDTGHGGTAFRGRDLLLALKQAFFGRVPVSLDSLANLATLPPERRETVQMTEDMPAVVKAQLAKGGGTEGINADGNDWGHYLLDDDEQAVVSDYLARKSKDADEQS